MNPIIPITGDPVVHSQKKTTQTSGTDFKSSLSEAMQIKPGTEPPPSPSLGEVQPAFQPPLTVSPQRLVSSTDRLLDLMEAYAAGLDNPGASLKDIAPILDQINDQANQLLKESETLAPQDDPLREIASEAALTARMEIIKFQRGDYL